MFQVAEFVGYAQPADLQGRDIKGKLVIWMPNLAAPGAGRGGGPGGNAVNVSWRQGGHRARARADCGRTGPGASAGRAAFTTGLHPDYHKVSDTLDKILFPKLARVAELVYQTGFSIANSDRVLRRDDKGPRTGFGSKAEPIN